MTAPTLDTPTDGAPTGHGSALGAQGTASTNLPMRVVAVAVVLATIGGALLGFGSGQRYRAEAVFSISSLEGSDASRPELQRIAEDLVVVSNLPSVRQEVRTRVGLLPSAEFEPDVGVHEEADGVVRFAATHADAETAEELALALATVSVEFLVEGRARPADDYVTLAIREATDSVLAGQSLVTPDDTVAVSLWPAFARSAVVAAVVSLATAVALLGLRGSLSARSGSAPDIDAPTRTNAVSRTNPVSRTDSGPYRVDPTTTRTDLRGTDP